MYRGFNTYTLDPEVKKKSCLILACNSHLHSLLSVPAANVVKLRHMLRCYLHENEAHTYKLPLLSFSYPGSVIYRSGAVLLITFTMASFFIFIQF